MTGSIEDKLHNGRKNRMNVYCTSDVASILLYSKLIIKL